MAPHLTAIKSRNSAYFNPELCRDRATPTIAAHFQTGVVIWEYQRPSSGAPRH